MSGLCSFEGCTVAETGICALEHDAATCEKRIVSHLSPVEKQTLDEPEERVTFTNLGAPVLERPTETASFPSSRTLGPDSISEMMAKRYMTIVGILGDPESGKTACLASLYLLVSNDQLHGWEFADSRSLMAFQDIAQGAREWNQGLPPQQMTTHTEMADDRRPGFLHLRLTRKSDSRKVDFALPDLPGEWTTELISKSRSDRFEFIKTADVLWLVIDGRTLLDPVRTQGTISRLGQLTKRLTTLFNGRVPRLLVIVTHRDTGELNENARTRLTNELNKNKVTAQIIQVASFSDNDDIAKPGHGLADVLNESIAPETTGNIWSVSDASENSRHYLAYRRTK